MTNKNLEKILESKIRKIVDAFCPTYGCENCRGDLHQGCEQKCIEEFKRSRQLWIEISALLNQARKDALEEVSGVLPKDKDYEPKRGGICDYEAEGFNSCLTEARQKIEKLIQNE